MPTALVDNELFVDFDETAGYDSEGNALSEAQVRFFSQSKCVDENGDLYLVYHADNTDYDAFDKSQIGTGAGSIFGKGFYFGSNAESVGIYGNNIKTYYLNLKRPFIYEAIEGKQAAINNVKAFARVLKANNHFISVEQMKQLALDILKNDGGLDTMIEQTCGPEKITDFFKKCGFDGIVNYDVLDFVAFEPNQIKLSSNTNPTNSEVLAASLNRKI